MPKHVVLNRFLVFFLLLSFLLISMAVLPIFIGINSTDSISVSQSGKTDSSPSLGLVIFNTLDYLAAENYYYQIGSGQTFQSRKLVGNKSFALSSELPYANSNIQYNALSSDEIYGQLSSNKITEFLHSKDGML